MDSCTVATTQRLLINNYMRANTFATNTYVNETSQSKLSIKIVLLKQLLQHFTQIWSSGDVNQNHPIIY